MLLVTPIACLLLAWVDPPATPDAPKGPHDVRPAPLYEVMVVNSGVEIVIKRDGNPVKVRLLGIDTPKIAPEPKVDRLNQRTFLSGLVKNKDLVSLETEPGAKPDAAGHLLAHVRRASDGLWLNLDMIEQGFATAATMPPFIAKLSSPRPSNKRRTVSSACRAPDFLDHAAQPAHFVRIPKRPFGPRFLARRPGIVGGNDAARPTASGGSNSNNNAEAVGQATAAPHPARDQLQ